jgi:hypothetical protein
MYLLHRFQLPWTDQLNRFAQALMNRDEKDSVLDDSEYLVTVSGGRLFDD